MTGVTEKFTTSDIGKNKENIPETTIRVHPRDIPRMRGERNENVHFFLRRCKLASLAVKPDPEIAREWLAVNRREPVWIWDHRPTLEHYRPK